MAVATRFTSRDWNCDTVTLHCKRAPVYCKNLSPLSTGHYVGRLYGSAIFLWPLMYFFLMACHVWRIFDTVTLSEVELLWIRTRYIKRHPLETEIILINNKRYSINLYSVVLFLNTYIDSLKKKNNVISSSFVCLLVVVLVVVMVVGWRKPLQWRMFFEI